MKCALYLRMSQDRNGDEAGIDRQREDCTALAERRGGEIVGEYKDNGKSASTGKRRPEYEAMLAAIERGEVDAVVAWSLDRLVRRLADLERLADLCTKRRVAVLLVRGSDIDMSTPAGLLVAGILGSVAKHETAQKADRQRRAARQRAERGLPGAGARRAFGYTPDGMALVASEAEAVRRAYEAMLAGRTLSGVAADLNSAGHRTTAGNVWCHNSVRVRLLNARNAGIRSYQGREFPAVWPAIVGEDTWRAVCEILARPGRRANGGGGARKWLGTNLFRCGRCDDARMVSTYRQAGTRIYRCPGCGLTRSAGPVDALVCAVVEAVVARDAELPAMASAAGTDEAAAWRTEAMALRSRRAEAKTLFDEGVLDAGELRETRARVDGKLAEIEGRLADAGRGNAAASVLSAADPVAAWEATAGQPDRRRAVVDALVSVRLLPVARGRRVFDPTTVEITGRNA